MSSLVNLTINASNETFLILDKDDLTIEEIGRDLVLSYLDTGRNINGLVYKARLNGLIRAVSPNIGGIFVSDTFIIDINAQYSSAYYYTDDVVYGYDISIENERVIVTDSRSELLWKEKLRCSSMWTFFIPSEGGLLLMCNGSIRCNLSDKKYLKSPFTYSTSRKMKEIILNT